MPQVNDQYPLSHITARIIAAAQEVHRELGPGFNEIIYQRALATELAGRGIQHAREVWMDVHYKGQKVGAKRVDFIIEGVMVELKARAVFEDQDYIQTLSYLKASGFEVGLLLNFGAKSLEVKRFVRSGRDR